MGSTLVGSTSGGVAQVALLDALARGPERWDSLTAASTAHSPFMGWAWHRAWAESAPVDEVEASFAVTLHGPGEDVRALIPLRLGSARFRRARVKALGWAMGEIGTPDHLDIPAAPGAELQAAVPLLEALPWDVILLTGVADQAANVACLIEAFATRGYSVRRAQSDSCPYIELPASWDDYLGSLTRTRRQATRNNERRLMREHIVTIIDYAPDRVDAGWQHLCSLHDERWAGAGTLGDAQFGRLLRRFCAELAARGELWLTTLDIDGEPAAAWLGFACGDTVYFYQGGRSLKWAKHSVGGVLMAAMLRRAIERGYRRFDFLRGREAYKFSWTSTERAIYDVVVIRPGWRGAWLRGLDLAARTRDRLRSGAEVAAGAA